MLFVWVSSGSDRILGFSVRIIEVAIRILAISDRKIAISVVIVQKDSPTVKAAYAKRAAPIHVLRAELPRPLTLDGRLLFGE